MHFKKKFNSKWNSKIYAVAESTDSNSFDFSPSNFYLPDNNVHSFEINFKDICFDEKPFTNENLEWIHCCDFDSVHHMPGQQLIEFFDELMQPSYLKNITIHKITDFNSILPFYDRRKVRLKYLDEVFKKIFGPTIINYNWLPFDYVAFKWHKFSICFPDIYNLVVLKMIWYELNFLVMSQSCEKSFKPILISDVINSSVFKNVSVYELLILNRPKKYIQNIDSFENTKRIFINSILFNQIQPFNISDNEEFSFIESQNFISINPNLFFFWSDFIVEPMCKTLLITAKKKQNFSTVQQALFFNQFFLLLNFINSTKLQDDKV